MCLGACAVNVHPAAVKAFGPQQDVIMPGAISGDAGMVGAIGGATDKVNVDAFTGSTTAPALLEGPVMAGPSNRGGAVAGPGNGATTMAKRSKRAAAGCKSTKAAAREKKAPAVGSGHRSSRQETTAAATATQPQRLQSCQPMTRTSASVTCQMWP